MSAITTTDMANWMGDSAVWAIVADAIGEHPYTYDMDDSSHRLDVVQIVMETAAKVLRP